MLSTFKKLASIAIIFAALKLLLNYPPFRKIENYIANRDPASATLDAGTLPAKIQQPASGNSQKITGAKVRCSSVW